MGQHKRVVRSASAETSRGGGGGSSGVGGLSDHVLSDRAAAIRALVRPPDDPSQNSDSRGCQTLTLLPEPIRQRLVAIERARSLALHSAHLKKPAKHAAAGHKPPTHHSQYSHLYHQPHHHPYHQLPHNQQHHHKPQHHRSGSSSGGGSSSPLDDDYDDDGDPTDSVLRELAQEQRRYAAKLSRPKELVFVQRLHRIEKRHNVTTFTQQMDLFKPEASKFGTARKVASTNGLVWRTLKL